MTYPSTLTSFTNPVPSDRLNSPSHSSIESAQNAGLMELQAYIGVNTGVTASTVGTLLYDIKAPGSDGGGHVQTVGTGGTGFTSYVKGDLLVADSPSSLSKLAIGASGQVLTVDSAQATGVKWASSTFGGDGSSGALTITSGTTTIDLAGAATVIKNYTSISITGTGALAFSNPHAKGTLIVLKSQGAVTITSSANPTIDLRSLGGTAGAGGGTNTNGDDGSYGISSMVVNVDMGNGGTTAGVGGAGGVTFGPAVAGTLVINGKLIPFGCGAGGAGGAGGFNGTNTAAGGGGGASLVNIGTGGGNGTSNSTNGSVATGGRGAGALYVECNGALNITGVINAAGAVGSNATTSGGGGGGGGGGTIVILYKTLTANTGTYTVTAGAAGSGVANGGNGGTGGTGASLITVNTEF